VPTPRLAPAPSDPRGPGSPGSAGEHVLQREYGTQDRAARFYADQVRDRLLPTMAEFVGRMEMVFVATADRHGECDSSLRAGPPGFVQVLDERTLAYPEYRGNGVHASLGNICENAHVGLLMVDFVEDLIGLHVNGTARVVADADFRTAHPGVPVDDEHGRRPERWVVVEVEEAYVHCRKHVPRMARITERREWGTDDPGRKGGDYFGARGTPSRVTPPPRRPFPSTTHLTGGAARLLRGGRAAKGMPRG
jgi:predicted pyridoxine 5'-phosphate oxidase superfamily flavin-nucleotide-binding protein